MFCQVVDFFSAHRPARWILLVILSLALLVLSLIFNLAIYYLFGFIFISSLMLLLFESPWIALIFLIIFRMITDYFTEKMNFTINDMFSLNFSQIIGIAIFIVGIIYIAKNFKNFRDLPLKIPIFVYILFSLFTVFYSINTFSTIKEIIRLVDLLFLFFLAFNITNSKKDFSLLLQVIFISAIIPAFVALYQYIFKIGYFDDAFPEPRILGTFSHPNSFSLYLFSVITLFFVYYFINRKIHPFWALAFPFYLLLLILTYTRVAWAAMLLFVLVIGVVKFRKILIFALIFSFTIYAFLPSVQERFLEAFSFSPSNSISWRKTLWKDAISETLSRNKQILGYGTNTFEEVLEYSRGLKFGSTAAHNDYVRSFVEGGVIGLLVFTFYIFYILSYFFLQYWKNRDFDKGTLYLAFFAIFFSIAVASLTDNVMRNTPLQWITWISTGAALGMLQKDKSYSLPRK
ncbi:MAG: O-antigen ligase family protein [Candidatus Moranbacteria bacterium]|nr:O-antigen ligase family protein [Candidatus Moranbacteria bacterium]